MVIPNKYHKKIFLKSPYAKYVSDINPYNQNRTTPMDRKRK